MNCLCCGKPLDSSKNGGWHKSCIKRFFGTSVLPEFDFDEKTLELIVNKNVEKGYTVPGVQKKLSLHLFSNKEKPRFTIVDYPTGYILKPQFDQYRNLPEAEHLIMSMAEKCGISVVPHALVYANGCYAYITKRVDRMFDGESVQLIAMEDFCQLDLRLTADKYNGSYERCAKIIKKYSSRAMFDFSELFIRLVFCFIVGNSDMHLKNFSLIETAKKGKYALSPAYDLLPVNIVMPEDKEEFALTMNGKKQNIRRKDFLAFSENCGISKSAANKMIDRVIGFVPEFITMCDNSLLPSDMSENLKELIKERSARIIASNQK